MSAAAVVLAGGRSRRMGRPKAALPWHGLSLLERTVRVLARVLTAATAAGPAGTVVVVHAPGQDLPPLPAGVLLRADPVEGDGPLQGLAVGLAAAAERGAAVAFACSTDLPFLHPAYAARVLALLTDPDGGPPPEVALPVLGGFRQPLAAAYRTGLGERCARLLAGGEHRPASLLRESRVRVVGAEELLADPVLAAADPLLRSVQGVDTPEAFAAAAAEPAPDVLVLPAGRRVRAATVAGLGLPPRALVELAGRQAGPRTPLVAGDVVTLR